VPLQRLIERLVHDAHAAATDFLEQLIIPERRRKLCQVRRTRKRRIRVNGRGLLDKIDHLPDGKELLDFVDKIRMLAAQSMVIDGLSTRLLFQKRVEHDREAVIARLSSE